MNRERLTELAERLEGKLPEGFEFKMGTWLKRTDADCGTAGCIAGLACMLWSTRCFSVAVGYTAAIELDLDDDLADALFLPDEEDIGYREKYDITPAHAAQAIRNVLEHGEPRWAEVMGPGPG